MKLLDGKIVKAEIAAQLKAEIAALAVPPKLVILQVGDLAQSNSYIGQKKKFAAEIGAEVIHKIYPVSVAESDIIADIKNFNQDSGIQGIILQLPVPEYLHVTEIIETIHPSKDVDGLTAVNFKKLAENDETGLVPATTKGILSLLKYNNVDLQGRKVLVIGRSMLVGKATALALLNKNATVTIAHSKTKELAALAREEDILIVAIGKPRFVTKDFVKAGQIVIDVGINSEESKLVGDVDFEAVKDIVGAISPVPGGVGAMTVASLFENLVKSANNSK